MAGRGSRLDEGGGISAVSRTIACEKDHVGDDGLR